MIQNNPPNDSVCEPVQKWRVYKLKHYFIRSLISLSVWFQKSGEYFFDFSGLWIKFCKAPCRKGREITCYFLIVLLNFVLDPLLRPHLFYINQSAPGIWKMAQLNHTHAAGWVHPVTSNFPFWCHVWHFSCLTKQLLKLRAPLMSALWDAGVITDQVHSILLDTWLSH